MTIRNLLLELRGIAPDHRDAISVILGERTAVGRLEHDRCLAIEALAFDFPDLAWLFTLEALSAGRLSADVLDDEMVCTW